MTAECQYCSIARGDAFHELIYENKRTVAFMEFSPLALGHTIVIPKAHWRDLSEADPLDVAAAAMTAQLVARAACSNLRADGVSVIQASGAAASQRLPHLHIDVVPRYRTEELTPPWVRPRVDLDHVRQAASALRQGLRFA